jgi:hypothetical protein
MKKIISNITVGLVWIIAGLTITLSACRKDGDGHPDISSGSLVADKLSPDSAGSGSLLTLTGTGLGDIRSIVFDKNSAPASFYSTLNTSTALIFRVPDTATRGQQNIVLTNGAGKQVLVPFKVLPFALVNSAFPTDFEPGTLVTLNGNNLDVLSKVVLSGTTTEATIVSRSLNRAVVQMPATPVTKAQLVLTTTAGDKVTTMEFVNVQQATAHIFTDSLVNPAQSWSWGGTYTPSADDVVTGSKSLKAAYDPAGTWGGLQIGMGSELPIPAGSKYFAFWAKGADADKKVTVQIKGNNWTTDNKTEITVPAGKWTYFKLELGSFIPNVSSVSVIVFQIHEDGKTIYYDNIMFIK